MKIKVLLLVFLLFASTCHAEDTMYNRYYTVIYNHVASKCPMGNTWPDWISRSILYYSAQYGIDPLLATALFSQESGFNMNAYSHTGAIGFSQLQPETAAALDVDPRDPAQNLEGGIHYLAGQLSRFSEFGEWAATYAIAAYNAGPNAVLRYGGIPPYPETQAHVAMVAKIYTGLIQNLKNS